MACVGAASRNARRDQSLLIADAVASKDTPATQNASQKSLGREKNKEVQGGDKIVATRGEIFSLKFTKYRFAAGLRPDPLGEL